MFLCVQMWYLGTDTNACWPDISSTIPSPNRESPFRQLIRSLVINGDKRPAGTFPPRKYRQFLWRSRNLSPPHHLPYATDGTGLRPVLLVAYGRWWGGDEFRDRRRNWRYYLGGKVPARRLSPEIWSTNGMEIRDLVMGLSMKYLASKYLYPCLNTISEYKETSRT